MALRSPVDDKFGAYDDVIGTVNDIDLPFLKWPVFFKKAIPIQNPHSMYGGEKPIVCTLN